MTENKRFRINAVYSKSLQELIGVIRDNDEDMYITDVVDLLNNLSEENEQLKKRISGLESVNEHGINFADKVWSVLLSMDKRDLLPIERIFFNNLCAEMGIDLSEE